MLIFSKSRNTKFLIFFCLQAIWTYTELLFCPHFLCDIFAKKEHFFAVNFADWLISPVITLRSLRCQMTRFDRQRFTKSGQINQVVIKIQFNVTGRNLLFKSLGNVINLFTSIITLRSSWLSFFSKSPFVLFVSVLTEHTKVPEE